MKERDKKLAGLSYDHALLEKQYKPLLEQNSLCPYQVKDTLTKVIKKLKKKVIDCSPKLRDVYMDDLHCYEAMKEAACEGRKSLACSFWNQLNDDSKRIFYDCSKRCPEVLAYLEEEKAVPSCSEEEEEKVKHLHSFPPEVVGECLVALADGNDEHAEEMYGRQLVHYCKKLMAAANKTSNSMHSESENNKNLPVKEAAESENTNMFDSDLPVESEYEALNSNKWALVTKKKNGDPVDEVELPDGMLDELTSHIKQIESQLEAFKEPGYHLEKHTAGMRVSQLESLYQLKGLLEAKTVVNVQKAMVYLTSLQSDIFHAMPLSVRKFLMKGYHNKSLIDYFREKK